MNCTKSTWPTSHSPGHLDGILTTSPTCGMTKPRLSTSRAGGEGGGGGAAQQTTDWCRSGRGGRGEKRPRVKRAVVIIRVLGEEKVTA